MGATLIAMASVMWALPFATPPAVETFGVRRSIAFVRIGAVTLAIFGSWYILERAALVAFLKTLWARRASRLVATRAPGDAARGHGV